MPDVVDKVDDSNLVEITDKVDLKAYIETDKDDGLKRVVLRVYKEGVYGGVALGIAPPLSAKVIRELGLEDV